MSYSRDQWNDLLARTVARIEDLEKVKGGEYATADDRLANFRRAAKDIGVPMQFIWRIYAGKHWDAITTYVNDVTGNVDRKRSEPISGRIHDLIVYLILLLAINEEPRS
jgi:hypothetical protein